MLTQGENELLTRVGPGTPAGELLRRYWYPIAFATDLTDEQPTRFVQLLGEDRPIQGQEWTTKLGTPDSDRLDVLATLIDIYEAQHYPMDPPDPVEAIKFRMEQQSLTRRDLEGIIGSRTRISEVLNRKRGLSIDIASTHV